MRRRQCRACSGGYSAPAPGQGLGEELRGKPAGRLPLLHVGLGLQLMQQSGRGEVSRAGEGVGASPERQGLERLLLELT